MTAGPLKPVLVLLALICAFAAGCNASGGGAQSSGIVHFVPDSYAFWSDPDNWTTGFGPAYANVVVTSTNFLPCRGGPYALCYYSGPSSGSENLSCTLTADGLYANCKCFEIPYGVYFVDINAILNHAVYEKTVAQCGADGSLCQTTNSAPVCQSVNSGTLIPGTNLFSTFSFDCIPTNGIGQTSCSQASYAGCMTTPCFKSDQSGIVNCSCPVFDGLYQVGQNDQVCALGDDLVWSAAYAPPTTTSTETHPAQTTAMTDVLDALLTSDPSRGSATNGTAPRVRLASAAVATVPPAHSLATSVVRRAKVVAASSVSADTSEPSTVPSPSACVPDSPGGVGCPLYVPGTTTLPPDSGVDCGVVCDEYNTCRNTGAVQVGYTCDATLCTDECSDRNLVGTACTGLSSCNISEIVKAETAASCSCCASQLCGCNPDSKTNISIATLNQQQRNVGITPQCDINGTLYGSP